MSESPQAPRLYQRAHAAALFTVRIRKWRAVPTEEIGVPEHALVEVIDLCHSHIMRIRQVT